MNKTFIAVLVLAATISFIPLAISQNNSNNEDAGMMGEVGSSQPINTDAIMASGVVAEGHWVNFEKPDDSVLQATLTPLQYKVTQKDGTERSFNNEYWDNEEAGIYVDIVSGEPLFSSTHKYKSGTGWPSFWQPLEADLVTEHEDRKLFRVRTEIRSKYGDNHIGHVFNDGPAPTGLRYCMNSAALKFIPQADLEAEGYGAYTSLFN